MAWPPDRHGPHLVFGRLARWQSGVDRTDGQRPQNDHVQIAGENGV